LSDIRFDDRGDEMESKIEFKNNATADSFGSSQKVRGTVRKAILTPMVSSILASLGIFGGISSLFVGIICVIIHGLVSGDRIFDGVGTILLIAAIPMILAGAIFLDEIEGKK
jgi:membrane-bound ClpP family serine protease